MMNIIIGNDRLYYKTNGTNYITTYISSSSSSSLDVYLEEIFQRILQMYQSKKIVCSNVCGKNVEYICKSGLLIDNCYYSRIGKLIITNWSEQNNDVLQSIESVFGPVGITIGASYHALVYLQFMIVDTLYYVAIETTRCKPYFVQFYVAMNVEDFETIIHRRYQCTDFKISFDCDKSWFAIAYYTL